jgi:hypothetical protein
MPLGLCSHCQRAFILDGRPAPRSQSCPGCGDRLEPTPVQHLRDLPQIPFELPEFTPESDAEPSFARAA